MDHLYAPWRSTYSKSAHTAKNETTDSNECVFCQQLALQTDEHFFILKRFKHCFVVLNKYPYNAGHLLILPLDHLQELTQLSYDARHEIMEVIVHATEILKKILASEGINVGINLGKAAGAGIPSHLHFHMVPRWIGDTNFAVAIAETKVISFDLHDIYKQLKPAFDNLKL